MYLKPGEEATEQFADQMLTLIDQISAERGRAALEVAAQVIYGQMQTGDPEGEKYPWVLGGNSLKQDEARAEAKARLAALSTQQKGQS
jgi:hypothetical protein